jgi:TetR/AcrR family transcriptional regulator, copper-responsive repressor
MVQKNAHTPPEPAARRRGRPRGFETETALTQAMDIFWQDGFAATSLDALSAATGLNRPSLYGAFGDKRALYLQAYRQYRKRVNEMFAPLFAASEPLRVKLERILVAALELYLSGEEGPRGCFTVLTTSSDAVADPEIRALVAEAIDSTDRAFGRLFAEARAAGELPANADARALARLASATIHTLSIRARARIPKAKILPIIDDAVRAVCGPESG